MRSTILLIGLCVLGLQLAAQTYTLSGKVTTAFDEELCDVEMRLVSDGGVVWTTLTNADGTYSFTDIPNDNYSLTGKLDGNDLNGVSTFDIVMTARHILGISILDPIEVLGADVNGTGSFTTLDMVLMRRVILGIDTEFPVDSWRIYASINGWPDNGNLDLTGLETGLIINGLSGDLVDLDFFAIKTGDLNGSPAKHG